MPQIDESEFSRLLLNTLSCRLPMISADHDKALRLFNGFYEGLPELVVDVYGQTLLVFSYCEAEAESVVLAQAARDIFLEALPWIKCVVVKHHHAAQMELRRGVITFGSQVDHFINEGGVNYGLDLFLNQDASFYLDTRNLRQWLLKNSAGLDVLNTFAYTGSLGIACLAGGAHQVLQLDRSRKYLELARRSAVLNHLDLGAMKLSAVDFFVGVGQLKRRAALFDLVIIDPPFFSVSEKGIVNQTEEGSRLINKVRPLVKDGGRMVVVNNALFLGGKEYLASLESLGRDGYLKIEETVSIPEDITGYVGTRVEKPPADPTPFNHPTKIVVLRVKKKNEQSL